VDIVVESTRTTEEMVIVIIITLERFNVVSSKEAFPEYQTYMAQEFAYRSYGALPEKHGKNIPQSLDLANGKIKHSVCGRSTLKDGDLLLFRREAAPNWIHAALVIYYEASLYLFDTDEHNGAIRIRSGLSVINDGWSEYAIAPLLDEGSEEYVHCLHESVIYFLSKAGEESFCMSSEHAIHKALLYSNDLLTINGHPPLEYLEPSRSRIIGPTDLVFLGPYDNVGVPMMMPTTIKMDYLL
jgi:hypothetical protein